MNTYLVSCEVVREFEAKDEQEAIDLFYEDLALSNESLKNFVEAKEIK